METLYVMLSMAEDVASKQRTSAKLSSSSSPAFPTTPNQHNHSHTLLAWDLRTLTRPIQSQHNMKEATFSPIVNKPCNLHKIGNETTYACANGWEALDLTQSGKMPLGPIYKDLGHTKSTELNLYPGEVVSHHMHLSPTRLCNKLQNGPRPSPLDHKTTIVEEKPPSPLSKPS